MSQVAFQSASYLHATQPDPLELPLITQEYLHVLHQIEIGAITLIESTVVKELHIHLHHLMVKAVIEGWNVTLIDSANCFNPQLISTIGFEHGMHGISLLQKIGLSRPFQYHQSISIVKDLVHYLEKIPAKKSLVVFTSLPSMFFDASVKQEDPLFPIPQLESYRQVAGILQSLALQGHTMIVTDQSEIKQTVLQAEAPPVIKPASMKYSAKIHVVIDETETQRRVELLNHPYAPPIAHTVTKEKIKPSRKKVEFTFFKQQSLDEFDLEELEYSKQVGSAELAHSEVSVLLHTTKPRNTSLDQFF